MTERQKVYMKAALAVVILLIVWLIMRQRASNVVMPPPTMNSFQAPYFTTNPGIPDSQFILNGGPTFNASNTVNVNANGGNGLSNSYMPLFGLVGMTAVGA